MIRFSAVAFATATTCFGMSVARAAPCCSGSSSIPAIITGDDRAQLSASLSHGTVIGDAPSEGLPVFRSELDSETTQTYRLDGAILLTDRLQAGAGLPILSRSVDRPGTEASKSGLGDIDLDLAYEVLPEWSYSDWKPRGHAFIGLTVPTGRSIYESVEPGLVDATGKGFYRIQTGGILIKRFSIWDATLLGEIHRSLPRTFAPTSVNPDTVRVDAGFGGSLAFGVGASPGGGNLRLGFRVQPNWNSGKSITTVGTTTESDRIQTVDTVLESSYLLSESDGGTWTVYGSYDDQTLLGPARNATLTRTLALGVQHRWDR